MAFAVGTVVDRGAETWSGSLVGIPAGQHGSLDWTWERERAMASRRGGCCGLCWWEVWSCWVLMCCGRSVPEQLAYKDPRLGVWSWAVAITVANLAAALVLLRFAGKGGSLSGAVWAGYDS